MHCRQVFVYNSMLCRDRVSLQLEPPGTPLLAMSLCTCVFTADEVALEFDDGDFDEPMDIGGEEEEEAAMKEETAPEAQTSVKEEPETTPQKPLLQ